MHSPAQPVTVKTSKIGKSPLVFRTGRTQNGYTIPLKKRLAADKKERKEMGLRGLAGKARSEGTGAAPPAAVPVSSEKGVMDAHDMGGEFERVKEKDSTRENQGGKRGRWKALRQDLL
ncbi:unnamed protein product [Ilex paraguariensis]|uniref:Uncharacterized protein n=1 Tax=Ilex paraguariensis TaxID=185542 RepID=A0ABC8R8S7_9AQUA